MSKYDPLGHFLARTRHNEVPMTFEEIEKLLGFRLPPKAQQIRAWWSNNPDNNVMTKVWLGAGFKTEQVDVDSRKLVFKRVKPTSEASGQPPKQGPLQSRRHPGFGLMKGLTTISPNTDLTAPTGEEWGRSK